MNNNQENIFKFFIQGSKKLEIGEYHKCLIL